MLYAYCIWTKENKDKFLQNSFIGGHFGAEMAGTARWVDTFENARLAP